MRAAQLNRVSTIGISLLSLTALATVLYGVLTRVILPEHPLPPEADETAPARIFQLSIAALLPFGLLFLASADWTQPFRSLRRLALPGVAVVLAFGILLYLENRLG